MGQGEIHSQGTTISYFYYDDGNTTTPGTTDYALIADFNASLDSIQLVNTANKYILSSTSGSLPAGTAICINNPGSQPDELLAIVQGVSPSSLNLGASYFNYVS